MNLYHLIIFLIGFLFLLSIVKKIDIINCIIECSLEEMNNFNCTEYCNCHCIWPGASRVIKY